MTARVLIVLLAACKSNPKPAAPPLALVRKYLAQVVP